MHVQLLSSILTPLWQVSTSKTPKSTKYLKRNNRDLGFQAYLTLQGFGVCAETGGLPTAICPSRSWYLFSLPSISLAYGKHSLDSYGYKGNCLPTKPSSQGFNRWGGGRIFPCFQMLLDTTFQLSSLCSPLSTQPPLGMKPSGMSYASSTEG